MIVLVENSSCMVDGVPAPPREVQDAIAAALGHRLSVSWLAGDRVRVESRSYVGSIELFGHISVRVVPKVAGDELGVLTMLALCAGARIDEIPALTRTVSDERSVDAIELICRLLATEAARLLVRGPVRDYRAATGDLSWIRGRIDFRRQALVHFDRHENVACRFDEFDHDVAENQLVAAGLRRARQVCVTATTRRRLAALADQFDQLTEGKGRQWVSASSITYDRRNTHYRPAHFWAFALLEGRGIEEVPPAIGMRSGAYVIDMNALFERFVEWFVARCLDVSQQTLTRQSRDYARLTTDGLARRPLIPDVVIRWEDRRLAVDAKYKSGEVTETSIADIYQLLIYAQTYRGFREVPSAVIVRPVEADELSQSTVELSLDRAVGREDRTQVIVLGLPLAVLMRELATGRPGTTFDHAVSAFRLCAGLVERSLRADPTADARVLGYK